MKRILPVISKFFLGTVLTTVLCWTCFGGMSGMSAMAMGDESNSTSIQCADSACGTSSTTMPMTADCAVQCLTNATEGFVSIVSLDGTAVALVIDEASRNEWLSVDNAEKTQRKFVSHHQRMFVVQRE